MPILPATHTHQQCRGSVVVEGRPVRVASWTAAYAPAFAGAFARSWCLALFYQFGTPRKCKNYNFQLPGTKFSQQPSESYEIPACIDVDIANIRASRAVREESDSFADMVGSARASELEAIRQRESMCAQIIGSEPVAGEREVTLTASLRDLLASCQWNDREIMAIKDSAPEWSAEAGEPPEGSIRQAADWVIERYVRQRVGHCTWVPILPATGSPGLGLTWLRWIYLIVHAGPLGGHKNKEATVQSMERLVTTPNHQKMKRILELVR